MEKLVRRVDTAVIIDDEAFPVLQWKATLPNQGSMGTASAEGALSDLIKSGIDVIALSQDAEGAPFDIYIGYDENTKLIFSGIVDTCEIDFDENSFEINGRDHACALTDGKQTMAGMEFRNQTNAQIVKQIAKKFDFEPEVTDSGTKAGVTMNGETVFNPQPQTYWALLQSMAENEGYECYVTPDKKLYFGPAKDGEKFDVNYGALPNTGAENPCWGLKVTYNPRNNSNIEVTSLSVNPHTTKKVSVTAQAKQVKTGKGRKTKSSLRGTPKKVKSTQKGSGSKGKHKTKFYIRCPGMDAEQAKARCQGMADSLAKRQIIVSLSIEGKHEIKVHSTLVIKETTIDLYSFAGVDLNVSEVSHEYTTPGDGDSTGGWSTTVRATAQIDRE